LTLLRERLTERDVAIVGQVAQLKFMSARHIETLHFPSSQHASALTAARACRRVLKRLVRDRLLVRLERRIGGVRAGSASFIYGLGPVGQRVLGLDGPRRRFREPTVTFVSHTLAISDLVADLTIAARSGTFELIELQAEPVCWRPLGSLGSQTLRPDLFVSLGLGGYEYRWFCELDLGTESLPRLLAKCQTYQTYYRTGVEQQTHGVFPRVVWLMSETARAQRLRAAIERSRALTSELFLVTLVERAIDTFTDVLDDASAVRGTP
jgi:hypothetical protein